MPGVLIVHSCCTSSSRCHLRIGRLRGVGPWLVSVWSPLCPQAIVSALLILGMDLTDDATMDAVWDIISNNEVIASTAPTQHGII